MKKMTEQDGKSLDIVNENLQALKAIFPESFTEDGVAFEVLRELLGDAVAEGEEKYAHMARQKKGATDRSNAFPGDVATLQGRECRLGYNPESVCRRRQPGSPEAFTKELRQQSQDDLYRSAV
ncbi:MAG: hypothetical protein V1753_09030 [Pseudomonadota bacterium]